MNKDLRTRDEKVNSAIIKLEKKHIIDRIKEKVMNEDLTKEEKVLLLDNIYTNFNTKRKILLKSIMLSKKKQTEIDKVSFYVLDAIDKALVNQDKDSMILLIKQSDLFDKYYEIINNRYKEEEKDDIKFNLRTNNETNKTK